MKPGADITQLDRIAAGPEVKIRFGPLSWSERYKDRTDSLSKG
jgi:hypothetical protein